MLGRGEEAQAAYAEAIETSRGVAASTYTKALAAVKSHTPELLAEMEAAARYLAQAAGLLCQLEGQILFSWLAVHDIGPSPGAV